MRSWLWKEQERDILGEETAKANVPDAEMSLVPSGKRGPGWLERRRA